MLTIEEYRKNSEVAKKMTDEECQQVIELQDKFINTVLDIVIKRMKGKINSNNS